MSGQLLKDFFKAGGIEIEMYGDKMPEKLDALKNGALKNETPQNGIYGQEPAASDKQAVSNERKGPNKPSGPSLS